MTRKSAIANSMSDVDPIKKPPSSYGSRNDAAGPVFCERILKLRFQLCLFLFFSMLFTMFNNLNLGLTILCMTEGGKRITNNINESASNSNERISEDENYCPACAAAALDDDQKTTPHFGNFSTFKHQNSSFRVDWSPELQMLMMSALSWGRLVAPFAGLLTDRMDNSFLMETSFLVAGICNALFPLVSSYSFGLVMALRVLLGVTDAVVQPCLNRFVAQWYSERTRTNAYGWATAGRQLGALIVFPISGFLCLQTQLLGGWPLVFYVSALGCCAWTFTFYFFKIVRLRKREKFIKQSTSFIISQRRPKIPWLKVTSSPVTWANLGAILCHEIPVNVLFVFLPRYIRDVMKVSIQSNSLLSVLPIVCFLLSKIGASQLDHVLKKRYPDFCATKLCKIFNSAGSLGLGAFLMAASFSGSKHVVLALACLCLGTASAGLHTPGCLGTVVTMAPAFAGSLSGFAYFFISLTSILNPLLIGAVVRRQSAAEWSLVFQCTSLVAFLPLVFFNLWGSAEEQPWSSTSSSKTVGKEEKNKERKIVSTIASLRSFEKDQSIAEKI